MIGTRMTRISLIFSLPVNMHGLANLRLARSASSFSLFNSGNYFFQGGAIDFAPD